MIRIIRTLCLLGLLVMIQASRLAADEPLTRVEIGKLGKAATALVEVKASNQFVPGQPFMPGQTIYASAFCIHPSGLFLTNEHVAQGDVTLVLNPGLKDQMVHKAKVVRVDKELDLALLRVEGVKGLPSLSLGTDENITELIEVVAVGFPFGTKTAQNRKGYPEVSVNVGSVTSLRRKGDVLHRIQLDAALNPGNSGGPVLDKNGKVVGMVVSGIQGSGVNLAIPASTISGFVVRPDVHFNPPELGPGNLYKKVLFEAQVLPVINTATPITVDLLLKTAKGKVSTYRMEGKADGTYQAQVVPFNQPPSPVLRLRADFENGMLQGKTPAERTIKAGGREVMLADVKKIQIQPNIRLLLHDGKTIEGPVSGLEAVPVRLGENSLTVDLGKTVEVRLSPDAEADQLWCTLLVRQGDKVILQQTDELIVQGLLNIPSAVAASSGIKPPAMNGEKSVVKLPSTIADVAVAGGGRYLVMHLPKVKKLAVFDVSAGEVVGSIPVAEENAKFAAGQEEVVVVLPLAGSIERWRLNTLERDMVIPLPIKDNIRSIVMGSATRGPLLVQSIADNANLGNNQQLSLFNVETMKLIPTKIAMPAHLFHMNPNGQAHVHFRAAANGKLFSMWCTGQTPSGLGTITISDVDATGYYTHTHVGYAVPSTDGKSIMTAIGPSKPQVEFIERFERGAPVLPACHGNSYLKLPLTGKTGAVTVHVPGKAEPVATLSNLEVIVPNDSTYKGNLTFDKRVFFIPDARLLILLPITDDSVILHQLPR